MNLLVHLKFSRVKFWALALITFRVLVVVLEYWHRLIDISKVNSMTQKICLYL